MVTFRTRRGHATPVALEWLCSLVVLSVLTANPQKPETDVVVVPGLTAITGQHQVELKVWISPALANAVPAAALEKGVIARLSRAGLVISNWTSPESPRPALALNVLGAITADDDFLYYVSVEYYVPLRVSLYRPSRAKKVGVFHDGRYGVTSRSRGAATVIVAVSDVVGRFVQDGYLKANQAGTREPPLSWGPPEFIVDVKEAMKGFMRPAEANLVVSVTASAPVSTVDVQSAAVNALSQKGLAVNTGSYFMSIYPQIAVFVDASQGTVRPVDVYDTGRVPPQHGHSTRAEQGSTR